MLHFDYAQVQGQRIEHAQGRMPLTYDDGGVGFDQVRLIFERCSLLMSADADNDELLVTLVGAPEVDDAEGWVDIRSIIDHIGSEIGWIWSAKNSMGYSDMIALSFSGIEPDIAIVVAASKLNLYRISRISG